MNAKLKRLLSLIPENMKWKQEQIERLFREGKYFTIIYNVATWRDNLTYNSEYNSPLANLYLQIIKQVSRYIPETETF